MLRVKLFLLPSVKEPRARMRRSDESLHPVISRLTIRRQRKKHHMRELLEGTTRLREPFLIPVGQVTLCNVRKWGWGSWRTFSSMGSETTIINSRRDTRTSFKNVLQFFSVL